MAKQLEDAGASALVMYSLFEEKIDYEEEHMARFLHEQSIGHSEAASFHPVPENYISHQDEYLEQLHALKTQLDIPIIASLNGTSSSGWMVADRPSRWTGWLARCCSRSRLSDRWTPRLFPAKVWISSTMTVRTVRNISRALGLVSMR